MARAFFIAASVAALAGIGLAHGAAPALPPLPTPAQLAAQAFPGWSDSAAGRVQTVMLAAGPGVGHAAASSYFNVGANRVLVDPRLVLRSDAEHVTLIAGLVPAGDDGKPNVNHTTPLALAAYQFEQHGASWNLVGREGVFALRGFFGVAAPHAVALSNQRQGVAVEYGSCWQGYCGTWLALYELDGATMRHEPAVEMALSGVNINAALDCAHRLQPLVKPGPHDTAAHDDGVAPDTHDCYSIDGSWAVDAAHGEPGDLSIHYQGAISRAAAHPAAPVAIDQKLVLRYTGGKYRAVSGFSPVPGI